MITNERKNALAKRNGLTEQRRVELIRERVNQNFPNIADEVAELRKAIADICDFLTAEFPYKEQNEKFNQYNALVENIKIEVQTELEGD